MHVDVGTLVSQRGSDWLPAAIQDSSLVAVADGLYIRQMYPDLCAAAFLLECKKGRGRIIGSFSEESIAANAYRGELVGESWRFTSSWSA